MNFWKQRDSQSWKILFFSLLLMSFACRSLVAPVERFINPETTFTPKMEGNVEGLLTTDTVQPSPSTTFSRTAIIEQNEQPDALFSTGTDKVTQNGALTELTASATPDVLEESSATPVFVTSVVETLIPDSENYQHPYPAPFSETTLVFESPTIDPLLSPTATPVYAYPTQIMPLATPTQEATLTPIYVPPWIAAKLKDTDPDTVTLDSGRIQLVEFFAFWCGTCQAMASVTHQLEEIYTEEVRFIYLDIDDPANDPFKKALRYRMQPHFVLLDKRGKVIKQWMGYVPYQGFVLAIEEILN